MRNSKAGRFDMLGMAADKAGSAGHGDHSTDQFVANNLNTVATANSADIANTAGTEHPRTDRSMRHIPGPEDREPIKQADRKLQSPR
jgi:hypothetical protein